VPRSSGSWLNTRENSNCQQQLGPRCVTFSYAECPRGSPPGAASRVSQNRDRPMMRPRSSAEIKRAYPVVGRPLASDWRHPTADYARSGCGRSLLGPGFDSPRLHSNSESPRTKSSGSRYFSWLARWRSLKAYPLLSLFLVSFRPMPVARTGIVTSLDQSRVEESGPRQQASDRRRCQTPEVAGDLTPCASILTPPTWTRFRRRDPSFAHRPIMRPRSLLGPGFDSHPSSATTSVTRERWPPSSVR